MTSEITAWMTGVDKFVGLKKRSDKNRNLKNNDNNKPLLVHLILI